jgi:hypothetical protein
MIDSPEFLFSALCLKDDQSKRLAIGRRRRKTGCLQDFLEFFFFDRRRLISPDTVSLPDEL